jgi:hypothetical protein
VDHHRQTKGRGRFLRAPQSLEIVGAGDVMRQSRLEADHDIAMACNSAACQPDIGAIDVHQLAVGGIAGARDVDEDATDLRRCPRRGSDLIDVVGSRRSAIDPPGHAVL